jgi:hypothetical protein
VKKLQILAFFSILSCDGNSITVLDKYFSSFSYFVDIIKIASFIDGFNRLGLDIFCIFGETFFVKHLDKSVLIKMRIFRFEEFSHLLGFVLKICVRLFGLMFGVFHI